MFECFNLHFCGCYITIIADFVLQFLRGFMLKRWQEKSIEDALNSRRVVILSGARQCGKTTTSKSIVDKDCIFRTLDDTTLLVAAQSDPKNFIKHSKKTMIIDEVQRVPELITAIKKAVDENTKYGQYLLTGSVNLQTLPTVKESLAGRVKKIRLRPLAQGEIIENKPTFLNRIAKQDFVDNKDFDKESLLEMMFKGGYPEPLFMKNQKERISWYKDYLNTIIEYDLKNIANIKRQDNLKDLIAIIASYSSKFIDKSKITSSMGIANQTLDSYLGILENTYLVDRLAPYLKTDYERVNKQSKYFVTDTGLMTSLLNWKIDDLMLNSDRIGKLFETYIYNQLIAQVDLENIDYSLYHYRDREKREIDFIIQDSNNNIYGIEVKSGTLISKDYFKHLKWFKNNLAKDKNFVGIVLYSGENVVSFGENMFAVPINNLWE